MKLLLATNNPGKVREYRALLGRSPYEVATPHEEGLALSVEEEGGTLEENAALKAVAFARVSGLLSLADDSGLYVDALDGEPGVRSARYAGPHATDEERVAHLLRRLNGVPLERRSASFRCVVAIATPAGDVHYASGDCPGIIASEPVGEKGFGYDPVFLLPDSRKSLAQLSLEEKNRISHRGKAARAALAILQDLASSQAKGATG